VSASASSRVVPEPEDPRAVAANLNVGIRLFVSAMGFVFVAFLFAFFYLKALNSDGEWRHAYTNPAGGLGVAILVCILASALLVDLARRGFEGPGRAWVLDMSAALVLGIAAVVLQIVQYATQTLHVTSGGYASVFYGFTVVVLMAWLGAVYWIETLLATSARGLPHPEHPDIAPRALLRPSMDACAIYLYFMAGIEVVAFVLLYLIK
jgi:heme/copper-type cytochrome/quinol oxidase subunit 3